MVQKHRSRRNLKRARSLRDIVIKSSKFTRVVDAQGGLCWFCAERMGADCTKEHLFPQKLGGTDTWPEGNLKAACSDCNSAAGHLSVEDKHRLRAVCRDEGRGEMFHLARQLRRADARIAFNEAPGRFMTDAELQAYRKWQRRGKRLSK